MLTLHEIGRTMSQLVDYREQTPRARCRSAHPTDLDPEVAKRCFPELAAGEREYPDIAAALPERLRDVVELPLRSTLSERSSHETDP